MGRVKELGMEQEYYCEWLCGIIDEIRKSVQFKINPYLRHCVDVLKNCESLLGNGNLQFEAVEYLNVEKHNIEDIVSRISANEETEELANAMCRKANILASKLSVSREILNSENFYKERVEALEADKCKLTEELANLTKQHGKEHEETLEQIAALRVDIKSKDKALQEARKQYEQAKAQVEAQNNISERITLSFVFLSQLSDIIRLERKRLNVLYYAYMSISGFILLCFFVMEGMLWYNALVSKDVSLLVYLKFFLPIPLCSGLLWFSVYQMNRAQRMLLNIVNQLHSIKYIEGLLLAVNNLSLNASEGIHKVQDILDQIVKKYLNRLDFLSDTAIDNVVSKDKVSINVDKLISVLSGVRNVLGDNGNK